MTRKDAGCLRGTLTAQINAGAMIADVQPRGHVRQADRPVVVTGCRPRQPRPRVGWRGKTRAK
jgi:hypothetical protein